jgi:programmed cell death protein 5
VKQMARPQNQNRQPSEAEQIRAGQKQEMLKNLILRQGVTSDARERLGRVRAANPELAEQAEGICIQIIQQGKGVDDKTLKIILDRLTPKREIRITRR